LRGFASFVFIAAGCFQVCVGLFGVQLAAGAGLDRRDELVVAFLRVTQQSSFHLAKPKRLVDVDFGANRYWRAGAGSGGDALGLNLAGA
jgi:hypothetical protein